MTMNFITIRDAVITTIGDGAAGKYRVIGYRKEGMGASENLDIFRSVQVFYSDGEFPKSSGSISGSFMHDITFGIRMIVAKAAECDLGVLQNPASTPLQLTNALAALQEASYLADRSFDEMVEDIFQQLMDARNIDFGLGFNVADRWVDGISKKPPIQQGELAVINGSMDLTCSIDEQIEGDEGEPVSTMDAEIEIEGDDTGKAGVTVDGLDT